MRSKDEAGRKKSVSCLQSLSSMSQQILCLFRDISTYASLVSRSGSSSRCVTRKERTHSIYLKGLLSLNFSPSRKLTCIGSSQKHHSVIDKKVLISIKTSIGRRFCIEKYIETSIDKKNTFNTSLEWTSTEQNWHTLTSIRNSTDKVQTRLQT